jgi:hypothetical protein
MSIGKRVSEAIEKMDSSDFEGALFAICAAIDATAQKEFNRRGRAVYKDFIHQNLGLITDIAFGGRNILNINLTYEHPDVKRTSEGLCTIQDIFYHVIRCGLYHEARLPGNIKFVQEQIITLKNNNLTLPSSLIFGFTIAVIISPVNKNENTFKKEILNLYNFPIPINKLWGRREEFFWLKDLLSEAIKIQSNIIDLKDK